MKINPKQINGNWRAGRALDIHSTSSHPQIEGYHTNRTEMGEMVYQVKYQNDRSKIALIAELPQNMYENNFRLMDTLYSLTLRR